MQIGVIFPQPELAADPGALRSFALAAEELGFEHLALYDHVLGADPDVHTGWSGPYDVATPFHEPLVALGYLAALTTLELVTSVLVLPQRETALVAKQAAEVDRLSEGRLRLGVGVGWNAVEFEALGQRFDTRGRRMTEQVGLLRRLWIEPSVTHDERFHRITGAGINPLPFQRPIPIWMGGNSNAAFERIGRLADGWFPHRRPGPELQSAWATIESAARDAGRDPAAIGMEGRIGWPGAAPQDAIAQAERWRSAGATHLAINTIGQGYRGASEHLGAIAEAASALGLVRRAVDRRQISRQISR